MDYSTRLDNSNSKLSHMRIFDFELHPKKSLEKTEIPENVKEKSLEKSLEISPKKPKSFRRLWKTLTNLFQHCHECHPLDIKTIMIIITELKIFELDSNLESNSESTPNFTIRTPTLFSNFPRLVFGLFLPKSFQNWRVFSCSLIGGCFFNR